MRSFLCALLNFISYTLHLYYTYLHLLQCVNNNSNICGRSYTNACNVRVRSVPDHCKGAVQKFSRDNKCAPDIALNTE